MEFFNQNKIAIFRAMGALMLVIGFAAHFWVTPKEGVSANSIAAANVARLEAQVAGSGSGSAEKKSDNPILQEYKNTRDKQIQYLTILAMIFGVGFLVYSFIKPKEGEKA